MFIGYWKNHIVYQIGDLFITKLKNLKLKKWKTQLEIDFNGKYT